jgi:ABC-type maltose transport system permease subunit
MTLTITIPRAGELVRILLPLAEPCLVAAAGVVGLGPLGQVIFATALKAVQHNMTR